MTESKIIFNGNEVSDDDRRRFQQLFDKLDANKDGTLDVQELAAALAERKDAGGQASEIMKKADKDANAVIDFNEFVNYMLSHEHKLYLAFTSLDKNKDGNIDPSEVQLAMSQLGISISLEEAYMLTRRIDKNHDMKIDWSEWRDYFNLGTEDSVEEMLSIWRNPPMIDIGEQLTCPPEFPKPKGSFAGVSWHHLLAGGVAGAVSRTATAPMDRLKVLLQVYGTNLELGLAGGVRHMINEGGVRSLWRGNGMSVLKIAPESAIKFAVYDMIKKVIKGDRVSDLTLSERFCAGSVAGATAQTAIFPMEVMKTRLAVSVTGQYKGIADCAVKIFQTDGVRAFYRGYIPNLIGIIPYAGIDLAVYETLKMFYIQRHGRQVRRDPGILVLLACGTISSVCGQLASYPLALVRTRLQAHTKCEYGDNFVAVIRGIVRKEGPRGLYRGLVPNFVKALPAVGISYVVYEYTKRLLGVP